MSLLYECINGVIQGGILEGAEEIQEREQIASLCVNKLRGMIVIDGDPNRLSQPPLSRCRPRLIGPSQICFSSSL